jgi:NTP pyrophosphatase (non-canonical NTP hydrolase)
MNFNTYQKKACTTATERAKELGVFYATLGIAGESGEVAEKVKKVYRDCNGDFTVALNDIKKELGDIIWYVAFMCSSLGIDFDEVAKMNLAKLASRKRRGVLKGSGDDR